MTSSLHRIHHRRAFSLLEMIVVVTVVASLLAITLPALFRPMGNSSLRGAAKQVETALLEARTRAVESGVPQEFRYEPGGGRYEIRSRPDADVESSGTSAALGAGNSGADVAAALLRSAAGKPGGTSDAALPESVGDVLPNGIVFADPQAATADTPLPDLPTEASAHDDLASAQDALEEQVGGQQWSPPLRFYPNGRAGNVLLKLRDTSSWSIEILLRGLVGTPLIGEPRHEETNPEAAPPTS